MTGEKTKGSCHTLGQVTTEEHKFKGLGKCISKVYRNSVSVGKTTESLNGPFHLFTGPKGPTDTTKTSPTAPTILLILKPTLPEYVCVLRFSSYTFSFF